MDSVSDANGNVKQELRTIDTSESAFTDATEMKLEPDQKNLVENTNLNKEITVSRGDLFRERAPILIDVPRTMQVPRTGFRHQLFAEFPKLSDAVFNERGAVGECVFVNPWLTDGLRLIFIMSKDKASDTFNEEAYKAGIEEAVRVVRQIGGVDRVVVLEPMVRNLGNNIRNLQQSLTTIFQGTGIVARICKD